MNSRQFKKGLLMILSVIIGMLITQQTMIRKGKIDKKEENLLPLPKQFARGEEPVIGVYIKNRDETIDMAFESYLEGVLGGEMPNNWPMEALKAQAILARTFAMDFFLTDQSKYTGADISTDIREAQAWNEKAVNNNIIGAVKETRGMVVVYHNNFPKTWFHSHAGGKTAYAKEGLNFIGEEPPYIKSVDSLEPENSAEAYKSWEAVFSKREVSEVCRKLGKETGLIDRIEVIERGPSGRAIKFKIGNAEVNAAEFRIKIGSMKLKSTKITGIEVNHNKVVFNGSGFGHGVGLSQWGAYGLANEGLKAEEIIRYYYKDVEIHKLWD